MVSNSELETHFKAFSQDYERTKTSNQLCERVFSMEAKLEEDLSTLQETLDKLEVAVLAKYLDRTATYLELRYSNLDPSLSPPVLANLSTRYPFTIRWI